MLIETEWQNLQGDEWRNIPDVVMSKLLNAACAQPALALATDRDGRSLLSVAAGKGDSAAAARLLALPNAEEQALAQNRGGGIPLASSCIYDRIEVAERLLALPNGDLQAVHRCARPFFPGHKTGKFGA